MNDQHISERGSWDQDVFDKFVKHVLLELASHKERDPDKAVELVLRMRKHLDEFVKSQDEVSAPFAVPDGGTGGQPIGKQSANSSEAKKKEGKGRNFLSKLRELVVLEYLNAETRPIALYEVQCVVADKGFKDSESAIISQLHRLHQNDFIEKPDNMNGVYLITSVGRRHLATLRATHGALLDDWLQEASSA